MRKISPKVLAQLVLEPQICARRGDGGCDGHITFEHTLIYAGRQIDACWAIVKLCEYHHAVNTYQDGGDLKKEKNVWLALNRASDNQLREISKAIDYTKLRATLNRKYGKPKI